MTNKETVGLLPCPFCGSEGDMLSWAEGSNWVICEICETEGPFGQKGDRAAALEAWNTRTRLTCISQEERIAELERALNAAATHDEAVSFLGHAFRNIDLPRLSRDDIREIADGLTVFRRTALTNTGDA